MNPSYKKIVLTVHGVPRDWGALREVLHMAVGLASGPPRHFVTVILMGDGVVHGLREHELPGTQAYLNSARAHGIELLVEQQAMMLRGLTEEHMREGIKLVSRDLVLWKLGMADHHLRI